MKTIGMIGGMSWQSSSIYYRIINEAVRDRLGGSHSARSLMLSMDFGLVQQLQHAGDWEALTALMTDAARRLETGGADLILICANTMHQMADVVAGTVGVPLLHIADPTAEAIVGAGHRRVGLLGTAFTMEQDFFRRRLEDRFGLNVVVPAKDDRAEAHRIIYDELVAGRVLDRSRAIYRDILARLVENGAEGVILGCTELSLLVDATDATVPLFDTAALHALAAVDCALVDVSGLNTTSER